MVVALGALLELEPSLQTKEKQSLTRSRNEERNYQVLELMSQLIPAELKDQHSLKVKDLNQVQKASSSLVQGPMGQDLRRASVLRLASRPLDRRNVLIFGMLTTQTLKALGLTKTKTEHLETSKEHL